MREYEITVNESQARRVALDIARDDVSIPWLVRLIDTAFDNVIRQEDAFAALNRMFGRHGYALSHVPKVERPAKACKVPDGDDEDDSTAPMSGARTQGAIIRFLRKEKNWSQAELAAKVGWKQGIISLMERDRQTLSAQGLKQLADALGVSIDAMTYDESNKTPMTEKTFLGRKHPVVDRPGKKAKASGKAVQRRFQEEGEDDDLPTRPNRFGKWELVTVTGPKVRAIIQANDISVATLRDSFEVTFEEYGRIRTQDWSDFGARWMAELLADLERLYPAKKVAKPKAEPLRPIHMTRDQIVTELRELFAANPWLTKEELINNYEFSDQDYAWVMQDNHTKIPKQTLIDYLNDVRGGIAERAIEVSGE